MLLIFDGWDEFKGRDQNRSFILDTITLCTYASPKLLQLLSGNNHVSVLGFEEKEFFFIHLVRKELTKVIAEQLIEELEIREYVAVHDSLVFMLYTICKFHVSESLSAECFTLSNINILTKFYKKYVIYAVKRSMQKQELDPDAVESLEELQEEHLMNFVVVLMRAEDTQ